ncbi:hypothetical protein PYCCODRAFT_1373154 [Trametes coccinea BRFM310]|uniref:N-acetyltransferase domain-containing protein n=1 Tax=Trametes coccinea (strain BRFM310) TaxID=1353009 RepID=A0A1Y2IED4_TRAC3|nr:hypothetical protein PYCCODRAFT_1373154 [Trametes coccinea BRFM310]
MSPTPTLHLPAVSVFYDPSLFPHSVWAALENDPRSSNIIYATAAKIAKAGASLDPCNLWVVCWAVGQGSEVMFVLSCTKGPIDDYPIFIYTPLPRDILTDDFLYPPILSMVRAIQAHVPPERVFSVFALDAVSDKFASTWTAETSIRLADQPVYYHAKLLCCTKATIKDIAQEEHPSVEMRPARDADASKLARLCHGFSSMSEPFVLTEQQAFYEASTLIRNGEAWIYATDQPGHDTEITCMVAVTRTTDSVSAITKVFTSSNWRSHRHAQRLVHFVCARLLQEKESVVLYVAHNNQAAEKVYRRVKFVAHSSARDESELADSWKELGFDREVVQLGHW